ncbi:hypothetical protein LTR62_001287 [Meristemomyces frigidus]|uniref:Uncharacterized protein n=1 Tax=Meristemomyces frigidus TaxID=1508187 RepID=A0AAN7TJW4_9PEZI|nr:hypothetical protein LTR62_001287 [Meristemomyces frigidus]
MANPKTRRLPAFLRQSKAEIHAKFVDLEWQQRDRLLQGSQHSSSKSSAAPSKWSRLTGDNIMARNRYGNVEPFAGNRIKLQVGEGMNDYINASPIQLGKRRYIATQGPTGTSVNHFYRMVAAEVKSPVVVVMLTQTHDAGREKCFQYYPLSDDESPLIIEPDYESADGFEGEVVLEKMRQDAGSRSEIRTLKLRATRKDDNSRSTDPAMEGMKYEEKEIQHLLFAGWPDFLVPEGDDREALMQLIQLSSHLNSPASSNTTTSTSHSAAATHFSSTEEDNPRIIHCSAGVGRTGTFIALDYLLSLLYAGEMDEVADGRDLVAETVDSLRQQRMMMVQGEGQFHFVYEVLREKMGERLAGSVERGGGW